MLGTLKEIPSHYEQIPIFSARSRPHIYFDSA